MTLIGCCLYTALQSWKVVALHYRNNGLTAATDIPLWIPHSALLFGFSTAAAAITLRQQSRVVEAVTSNHALPANFSLRQWGSGFEEALY